MADSQQMLDDHVAIGMVRRAVGLDGRVEVELYSGDPARLTAGSRVWNNERELTVVRSTPGRKGLMNVYFEGIVDRDGAEALRGAEITVPESELPPPAEGTYYHFQIMGSAVVDATGARIGSVSGIMETGANDVYVVETQDGAEILVPATRNTIKEVDTVNRVITVDLPQ